MKEQQKIEVVILSLTCAEKTLQNKVIDKLKNAKKTFSEQYRSNILLGELDTAIKNYCRATNSTKEKRNHCDMINAICERIGKDIIRAKNVEAFKASYAGKKMIAKLTANNFSFEFRTTTVPAPVQTGKKSTHKANIVLATA